MIIYIIKFQRLYRSSIFKLYVLFCLVENQQFFISRRRFDFQSPSRMDRNVEMFMQIEKALIANKYHVQPCIYIKPNLDKPVVGRLKDIIKRHQGTLAENPEDATHIIHSLPANHGQQEGMN